MEGLTPNPATPAPAVHPEQSNVQASLATQQQQSITTGYEPNAQPPPWMSADQQLEWYLAQHAAQRPQPRPRARAAWRGALPRFARPRLARARPTTHLSLLTRPERSSCP